MTAISRYLVTTCTVILVLFSATYLISHVFTNNGIDESVVYHLIYGLRGAGFGEYRGIIILACLSIALAFIGAFSVYKLLQPSRKKNPN